MGKFVGKQALAAVASSGNLIFMMTGFFMGLFIGAGIVIAQYFGAKNYEKVRAAVHTDFAFALCCGVLLTLLGVFFTPTILTWMRTPADVLDTSILYFRLYFLGSLATILYNAGMGILQAVGDSRHPLYYLIFSSIVNIVLDLLFVGALMVMAINPPLGRFNAWLSIQLDGMQGGSRLVLGTLLGGMMATDYGGPINKAAYVSGTLALVDQQYDLMAAVMAGGMIPTLLMGATFVTEGALPFALRDPLRVSLACIAGSALAGFITILLGCGCPAPHGGLFLLPVMENPPGFLIALAVGTLTTALLLGMLKKPLKH